MMFKLQRERGSTLILVTHDETLARRCDRIVKLRDGYIESIEDGVHEEPAAAKPAPPESTPTESTPPESAPAQSAPSESAPSESTSSEPTPPESAIAAVAE